MESTKNIDINININIICKIEISDQKCNIFAETTEGEKVNVIFEDVWDCRYAIENAYLDRSSKINHTEIQKSSILEIYNSNYVEYFQKQVSGTRPVEKLKDFIIFDRVETVFEVLTNNEPYIIKE